MKRAQLFVVGAVGFVGLITAAAAVLQPYVPLLIVLGVLLFILRLVIRS